MKKLIVLLILISVSVWGRSENLTTEEELNSKIDKLSQEFDKNDLIVEAIVKDVKSLYYLRSNGEYTQISEEQIRMEDLSNIKVVTKVTMKVVESFKNRNQLNKFNVWIMGGRIKINGELHYQVVSNAAHSLLDRGDKMIVGLKKGTTSNRYSQINSEFLNNGYYFSKGKKFQIPTSEEIIKKEENNKLENAKRKLENENLESIEVFNRIEKNYLKAKNRMNEIVEEKVEFVQKLKQRLRRNHE